jgi:neutrophil factor 2
MSFRPTQPLSTFLSTIQAKFPGLGEGLKVRFKDEDGDMLDLEDDGDFEAAIDVAR